MKRIVRGISFIRRFGIINAYYQFRNRRLITIAAQMEFEVGGTSITDSSSLASYPTMCALAARDKSTFSSFRKYEILVEALDHVSIQQGLEYLEEIVKLDGWTANSKKSLKKLIR